MKLNVAWCHNCICRACTAFKCPYHGNRCKKCDYFTHHRLYDCDFFEYYKVAPKRLKIVRKSKSVSSLMEQKLDAIMKHFGMTEVNAVHHGMYAVYTNINLCLFKGSKSAAEEYIQKWQQHYEDKLTIKPLRIDIY